MEAHLPGTARIFNAHSALWGTMALALKIARHQRRCAHLVCELCGLRGKTIGLQLREDGILDAGVAREPRMEGTQPPAVRGRVASSAAGSAPGCDAVPMAPHGLNLMQAECGAAVRDSGIGDALAGEVIEVPEINGLVAGVRVPLAAGTLPGLAKAVAGELGVEVDVADLLRVLRILGNVVVQIVHFGDVVVERLSQLFAEIGGRRYPWNIPMLVVAPVVEVGSPELSITSYVEKEI